MRFSSAFSARCKNHDREPSSRNQCKAVWPHQQPTCILGIVLNFKGVVKTEGLIGEIEIRDAGLGDAKQGQRAGEKVLNRFDLIGALGDGAKTPALRQRTISETRFADLALEVTRGIEVQFAGP